MPSPEEAVGALYHQAAEILGSASGATSPAGVDAAHQALTTFAHVGDQVSTGLFPLALALLILHENYEAACHEGRFRVAHVLGRGAVIAAFLHPWTYGHLCGLITSAAGGHGGWMSSSSFLGSVTTSVDGLRGAWQDYVGDDAGISDSVSAALSMLPLIGIWLVLVCSLLAAYVAGLLLSVSQAVLLSILLAVGKTCLAATLVPGVGLGASWARSLAKVAAWSTLAAIVTSLMLHAMPDIQEMVRHMGYTRMLRTAGQFIVLALCTFAVPFITERIFSGAAPAGNAALQALTKGWHGAALIGGSAVSGARAVRERLQGPEGQGPGGGFRGGPRGGQRGGSPPGSDPSARPHKVAPSRLRAGLHAVGQLAALPLAGAAFLLTRRDTSSGRGLRDEALRQVRPGAGVPAAPGSGTLPLVDQAHPPHVTGLRPGRAFAPAAAAPLPGAALDADRSRISAPPPPLARSGPGQPIRSALLVSDGGPGGRSAFASDAASPGRGAASDGGHAGGHGPRPTGAPAPSRTPETVGIHRPPAVRPAALATRTAPAAGTGAARPEPGRHHPVHEAVTVLQRPLGTSSGPGARPPAAFRPPPGTPAPGQGLASGPARSGVSDRPRGAPPARSPEEPPPSLREDAS